MGYYEDYRTRKCIDEKCSFYGKCVVQLRNTKVYVCVCNRQSGMYGLFCEFEEELYKKILTTVEEVIFDEGVGSSEEQLGHLYKLYYQGLLDSKVEATLAKVKALIPALFSKESLKKVFALVSAINTDNPFTHEQQVYEITSQAIDQASLFVEELKGNHIIIKATSQI